MDQRDDAPEAPRVTDAGPAFAHVSEAEFARILDYYQVRWEYEPHTFPILWNLAGDLLESFSPDFFLPELELYVELTTLRQKLVRKKNRKLRRLRELYPDLRIKLFYARDFRALMLKYGRLELADELSGHGRPRHPAALGRLDAGRPVRPERAQPRRRRRPAPTDGRPGQPEPAGRRHHRRRRRSGSRSAAAEQARASA